MSQIKAAAFTLLAKTGQTGTQHRARLFLCRVVDAFRGIPCIDTLSVRPDITSSDTEQIVNQNGKKSWSKLSILSIFRSRRVNLGCRKIACSDTPSVIPDSTS